VPKVLIPSRAKLWVHDFYLFDIHRASGQQPDTAFEPIIHRVSVSQSVAGGRASTVDGDTLQTFEPGDLADVVAEFATFLMPHAVAAASLGK
jgi:hypothetical protein